MPEVTIVVVTRNRCLELRRALASAVAQRGLDTEIVVVDDASDDGTSEMVAAEFPSARLQRLPARVGLVVGRNRAARLAHGHVIVSLDDDAEFSSEDCVAQTLRDFDHPRIGAVAMPYDETIAGHTEHCQRAPAGDGAWVTPTFRGTAYAVRRDVFLALNGFREEIVHQGEEDDFCLRLLAAGYAVRLGRARPIHHHPSVTRDLDRMDTYGRRNELLWSFTYFPAPAAGALMAGYAVKGLRHGWRVRRPWAMVRGLGAGLAACWRFRHGRRPVSWRVVMLDRRLRRAGALPLDAVARDLERFEVARASG